jgi:hypothetical protein
MRRVCVIRKCGIKEWDVLRGRVYDGFLNWCNYIELGGDYREMGGLRW